ncbi:MAG: PAS domain S-box protein [Sedimenticola sp.]
MKSALEKAQSTGEMAVSGRLKLSMNDDRNYGVIACLPFYQTESDSAVVPILVGFVVAVLKLDELAHAAISYLEPRGVDLLIQDDSADKGSRFLEFYASRLNPTAVFHPAQIEEWLENADILLTEVVQMGDRKWSITAVPNTNFRSAEAFQEGPFVVLFAGILLTLLLSIYLLRIKLGMQERLKMGQLLKDREELFWQMTETVDEVFWALSADRDNLLYVSPAIESIWGIKCQALYENTKMFSDAIHPDDRTQWLNALENASHGAEPIETIYRVRRPDGTQRWVRDNAFPVHDKEGQVFRLVGVAEDITEKKQADDALRDSENKLRTIFNQSPDRIMTVEGGGEILLMNHGAALELPSIRSEGIDSATLLPTKYQDNYRQLLTRAFQNGEVSYFQYRADDESTWWEIRIVPITEEDEVNAAMVIATDITEKRNYQTQAIRNARLASIGVLATGVAHEINNPNNAIQTSAALYSHVWQDAMPVLREYYREQGDFSLGGLSFANEGESLGDLISEIKDNSRRIKAIVENLKHIGKKDRGDLNEEVDINTALRAAAGVLKSTIDKYTDHWVMELSKNLPPVRGNLQQLEQVFINVMLNALQSLKDKNCGVRVKSDIDPASSDLLIQVVDQGSGIAEDDLPRVTEPFFTTRLEAGGTGLGLSISSTIIENHHGSITFYSSSRGTRVTLRLPVNDRIDSQ